MSRPLKIDPEAIRRLSVDYGIDAQVLAHKLPLIFRGVHSVHEYKAGEPDAEEIKRHRDGIRSAAATLRQRLVNVPMNSLFHAELFERYEKLYPLRANLSDLIAVLDTMDTEGRKPKAEVFSRDALIGLLVKLWERQTGRPATTSTRPGEFIAFMCECADLLGFDSEPLPRRFSRIKD